MTERKEGQFEDQATPLVCLHISDRVAASSLTCSTGFSGSLCLPHHTRLSVDHSAGWHQNTAEPMPGLLHCSSFYVEVHLSSVLHRETWLILTVQDIIPQESAVQNCDSSYSSQLWQNLFIFLKKKAELKRCCSLMSVSATVGWEKKPPVHSSIPPPLTESFVPSSSSRGSRVSII